MTKKFDVIVIGAGSGGLTVAIGLAWAWKKVALIEKWAIWGDCTNFGCVPSKAFLDIARKWEIKGIKNILAEVRNRRRHIQDEETPEILEKKWIHVFLWVAKFEWTKKISTDNGEVLEGKNIVIATGSSPQVTDIPWANSQDILTNKNVFELDEDIQELVIVGGWYIWCELAEAFVLSGVQVTLVQRNGHLIPREEVEASEFMKEYLESLWVKIYIDTNVIKIDSKNIVLKNMDKEISVNFDKVLFALWRIPNVKNLWLEDAKIKYSEKWILTNDYLETSEKWIYAIWDCVYNNPQFTHLANYQWRKVIRNILLSKIKSRQWNFVLPSCLYTKIEVSRIWKTQTELEKLDPRKFKTYVYNFVENDRSKITHQSQGFIKVHFSLLTWKVLWATIVWENAGELIGIFTLAMQNKISAYKISNTIFSYPTKSEAVKKVCDMFVIDTLKNIKRDMIMFMRVHFLKYFPVLVWGWFLIILFILKSYLWLTYEEFALELYNFFSKTWYIGVLTYIFVYAIRPVILFPASFMTFMSGAIWGPIFWVIYTVIGSNLWGQVGYFMSRYFWKDIIDTPWEKTFVSTLKNNARENPFMVVLWGRLLFMPYDLLSFACWFLKLDWKSFTFWTFLWTLPGTLSFVLAWASFYNAKITSFSEALSSINITLLYFAAWIFLISVIISKILKKYLA